MYDQISDLPLTVDSISFDRRERETSSGFTRATTIVSLHGDGETGRGEDVTYTATEHDPSRWERVSLPTGTYTLDSFSSALDERALFPEQPERDVFEHYRRWGIESAALDLALRRADTTLGDALGRTADPVRFAVSTRLSDVEEDDPPTTDRLRRWLDIDPSLEFKLDPTPDWTDELVADVADTGAVRILDFKSHYEGTEVDNPPDRALYERLVEGFPDAILEDPALTDRTRDAFDGHRERVSWDAPIHGIDSIKRLPFEPSWLNVKPSRFGSVERLLEAIEYCEDEGIRMYGGGQFELGVGRRGIQVLASLFYPDAPNDVAPRGYNDPEPRTGLPSSPLDPPSPERGFANPVTE